MVETARYSLACLEDLAIGIGTRQVRLANNGVYTLHEINLTGLLQVSTYVLRATDFNGLGAMTLSAGLPASRRLWGVTVKNLVAFGATGGLTGYTVGDPTVMDRWSNATFPLTVPFESDEGDFLDPSLMIYTAATDIIISGIGGLFDATGSLEVAVHTSWLRHPS